MQNNLIIISVDSVEYNNYLSVSTLNMFCSNRPSSDWQEWMIITQFRVEIEISFSFYTIYLLFLPTWRWPFGPKHVVELILKNNCCVRLNILWFLISKTQCGWTVLKLKIVKISNFDWTLLVFIKNLNPFWFCECKLVYIEVLQLWHTLWTVMVWQTKFVVLCVGTYLPVHTVLPPKKNSHHQTTSDLTENDFFSLLCKFLPYSHNYYKMVFLLKIHGFLYVVLCQLVNSYCCLTVQDTLFGMLESEIGGSSLLWSVDNYWLVDMTETVPKQICIIFSTSLRTSNSGVFIH